MGTITIIDGIYCKASRDLWPHISRLMEYQGERWKQGPFHRTKEIKTRSFLDHRGGKFLCGFLPRVIRSLRESEIEPEISQRMFLDPIRSADLFIKPEGMRVDQYQRQREIAIQAIKEQRGVIQAPTGSGKTTIAMLIASMFCPKHRTLFLCHTVSLLTQSHEEFTKAGFKNVSMIGGGRAKTLIEGYGTVVCSTIQTFSKFNPTEYCDLFDVVIVDEAHHVNSLNSQYGKVLTHLLAPIKIGFTATIPSDKEAALALEGIIGPVIGKVSIQEGVDMKIMAKPTIKLIPVPYNSLYGDIRKYQDLYKAAIVDGRIRNTLIAEKAIELAKSGLSSLIIVKEIQHGDNLVGVLQIKGVKWEFVQGNTEGDIREKVKKALDKKDLKIVICTAVWKEGINIPSLNCVINAAGGKSEIATLQAIGRGLRSIPGKKEIVVYDFLDPYKYLAQHAIQRISIYVEAGWI